MPSLGPLHRTLSVFNSFGENIPRGLLDAIEALLAMQLGLEEQTNLLQVILNRWARLHWVHSGGNLERP